MRSNEEIIVKLSSIITRITGVQLGEKQRHMVESRLTKRMLDLNLKTLEEYYSYFEQHEHEETQGLISLLTTHHTYFFREFSQIQYVCETMLPELIKIARTRPDKTIQIWSAASSYGQEVYSLAMALHYHLGQMAPDVTFRVHGTDVDPKSVLVGKNGVYARKELNAVPSHYSGSFWMRGTGAIADYVKAKESLKKYCSFDTLNLMEEHQITKVGKFDVIFCRNVFIYFTPDQIKKITQSLFKQLHPHGALFIGISESLHGLGADVHSIGPSIYKSGPRPTPSSSATKPSAPAASAVKTSTQSPQPELKVVPTRDIRVLCVDDSPTVLAILKKVFAPGSGYEIVGTAVNGKDAIEKVKTLKPDVMTLDIHMPEMDGVSYLKSQYSKDHCPVVMISSVSRDNQDLAIEALNSGASDYIEKPSLNQLSERIEEIRMKVRCALDSRKVVTRVTSADHDFKRKMTIPHPEKCARVFMFQLSDRTHVLNSLKETSKIDPPSLLVVGNDANLEATQKMFQGSLGHEVKILTSSTETLSSGVVYFTSVKTAQEHVQKISNSKKCLSFLVYSGLSAQENKLVETFAKDSQVLLSESQVQSSLAKVASDIFPTTSFIALSQEYFATPVPGAAQTRKAA